MRILAAIDIGSYELCMKIFEFSAKNGMKEIDCIRHRLDLGTDTYTTGKITHDKVEELCRVLREFTKIMKSYKAEAYRAYATSAIRETSNTQIILDQIRQRTGLVIGVLSNSEQRFLDYKSIASKGEEFNRIIEQSTAILDIGGGSIQISLFMKDMLVATQNLRLGVLRLQERINHLNVKTSQYEGLIDELVSAQLSVFKKMFLKDRVIKNIIIVDDYLSLLVRKKLLSLNNQGYVNKESFERFMGLMRRKAMNDIVKEFDLPEENVSLLFISAVLAKQVVLMTNAELIWTPGVTLCDGIAYEYAEKNKMIVPEHDFEQDIIGCALNLSKRYMGSRKRGETLEKIALTVFDSMKPVHGMGKRERLLLRISTLLHDCGKYISMMNLAECSYNIIMSTEIIGLSHKEREIVANVVRYNHIAFDYYGKLGEAKELDRDSYLTIAKLTAILRVANGLDRSHKQKFKDVKTELKEDELIIIVSADADITLEKGLFGPRADFFEEVFSVKPVIKQKRTV